MTYDKHEWTTGDTITAELLNNIEQGIYDVSDSIPSLEGYVTEEEMTSALAAKQDAGDYPSQHITSSTGTAMLWNETTGGGAMYQHTDGSRSAVCVNNGGADSIAAQIYAIDYSTKLGTRINIFNKGVYYIPNKASSDSDYQIDDPDQEIAVKGDLTELSNKLSELETRIAALEN